MLGPLSHRLLTLLQLTRMALVFTAISDGAAEVLLAAAARAGTRRYLDVLDPKSLAAMAAVSVGLYGFGMSLNDIIDRRRDSRIAAHRPLPSGRIGLVTAHGICVTMGLLAVWGALAYARWAGPTGKVSLALLLVTVALIVFYDLAGKYLVPLGLIVLGAIRFLHASIAAPWLPVVWHPLLLLNHVTVLSTICYHWEQKRPTLTSKHWWTVLGGLAAIDAAVVYFVGSRRGLAGLDINAGLLAPLAAVGGFVALAFWVRRSNRGGRDAGGRLMLYGLLWLIVYDTAFVAGRVSLAAAGFVLCLLPIAWWSVQLMRWWSNIVSLSHRPVFQRAR